MPTAAMPRPTARLVVQEVVKCKWSLTLLALVGEGVARPLELQRRAAGISYKVMNQRLAKLVRFGALEKSSYDERPPRVEYRLTPFGRKVGEIIGAIDRLQAELDG